MKSFDHNSARAWARDQRGLTMLEVTLILAALVVVSAAVAPSVLDILNDRNARNVLAEMEALHAAMVGDLEDGTYGFVGDLGRLPFTLDELVEAGSLPLFTRSETSGVGYGWNGPYATTGTTPTDFRTDPWGNEYDVGVVGFGQVRSYGPNGIPDDADDLVYPAVESDPYGSLLVLVKGHSGEAVINSPDGCTVTLFFSDSGQFSDLYADLAPFSFDFVHRGLHEVQATCPAFTGELVTETGVAQVRGGGAQQTLELHVELGEEITTSADPEPNSDTTAPEGDAEVTTWD